MEVRIKKVQVVLKMSKNFRDYLNGVWHSLLQFVY